jgi:hypothetical protein
MWNVISSNRILDRKMKEKSYLQHKKTLLQIKSQIDNQSPQKFNFLFTKPKTKQLQYCNS